MNTYKNSTKEFLEKRRKFFVAKRAEKKKRKTSNQSSTKESHVYLSEKHRRMEEKSFEEQKVENDKEQEELKRCLEIIPDDGDEVTIDATHLSSKSPTIVDYKIYKEGRKRFSKFSEQMTKPVDEMNSFLMHTLKTMFEQHVGDTVWKNQQELTKVKSLKLYDSCGVHCVTMQNIQYYLLVEKMYSLTNHILHQMFNNVKLLTNDECEMAYELLRLVKKQLKE
uniref:Uncharacterized protein n=1 Tax=Tanacetum cinerariifolium TaxID=118510 RepID=A0A699I9N8_TANCI|nr:hypothetical protein [Tanacetum cinerariifolium]